MAEKRRKPLWARLLIGLMSTVLSLAVLLALGCGFLYLRYQINVIEVIKQIKIVNQPVDVEGLTPRAFATTDLADAKTVTDAILTHLIDYNAATQTYTIPGGITDVMAGDIRLTDKQIGAVLGNIVDSQPSIDVQIGGPVNLKDYGFKIMQVTFDNIQAQSADFNIVVKLELTKVKESMTTFPLNWLANYVPKDLYISSTITVTHDLNDAFVYTTEGKAMRLNNLTETQTESILKTANTFLQFGTAKQFSKTVADAFVNVLIGNQTTPGLTYGLGSAGATDYAFETDGTNNYFVIKK